MTDRRTLHVTTWPKRYHAETYPCCDIAIYRQEEPGGTLICEGCGKVSPTPFIPGRVSIRPVTPRVTHHPNLTNPERNPCG